MCLMTMVLIYDLDDHGRDRGRPDGDPTEAIEETARQRANQMVLINAHGVFP